MAKYAKWLEGRLLRGEENLRAVKAEIEWCAANGMGEESHTIAHAVYTLRRLPAIQEVRTLVVCQAAADNAPSSLDLRQGAKAAAEKVLAKILASSCFTSAQLRAAAENRAAEEKAEEEKAKAKAAEKKEVVKV